jgi:hypothetical protein
MTSTRLRMGATAASVAMFALAVVVLGALTPAPCARPSDTTGARWRFSSASTG